MGVMIVGEAHMNDRRRDNILSLFGRVVHIEYSADTDTPNAKEIIPGRAMLLNMKDVNGGPLTILGIYAPNAIGENAAFWTDIRETRRPDLMGGDMNVVEDPIDRLPAHPDANAAVTALDELKSYLRVIDGWREMYPTTRAYTYHQLATGSQSRLDRFYIKRDRFEHTMEWEIRTTGIRTDHKSVSLKITTEGAPTMGHGRWVWPAHLTRDKVLTKYIHDKGMSLTQDIVVVSKWQERDPEYNVQTLWAKFKLDITKKARERAKIVVPKLIMEIAAAETKLDLPGRFCTRATHL
ncbi:DNase I-like protein [Mycena rebaudengoi]|nr:DNase I-like protein [Mycena rebaudengoi]